MSGKHANHQSVDSRENKEIKSVEEARLATASRAKYLFALRNHDELMVTVVTQTSRDIVWQIVTSSDDWKDWQFEISRVLFDERYSVTASVLAGRCLQAILNGEVGEAILKFARNLLTSLTQFSAANSKFQVAVPNELILFEHIFDFVSGPELPNNQDGKMILLIRISLRLPLLLWNYLRPQTLKKIEEKFVDSADGQKVLPALTEMKDEECRCLAYLWLLRLGERKSELGSFIGDIDSVVVVLVKFLKISFDKNDNDFVSWLVHGLFTITRSPENLAKLVSDNDSSIDASRLLVQLVENQGRLHLCSTLQKARQMLSELASGDDKWNPIHFKANEELTSVDAARNENIMRIGFLKKLYELSPDSLVCADAVNALNLLKSSRNRQAEERKGMYENVLLEENFAEIALKYDKMMIKQDLAKEKLAYEMASALRSILWNLCDTSEEFRISLAKCGYVSYLLENLKNVDEVATKSLYGEAFYYTLLSSPISILYNTSRSSRVKHKFLEQNAADVLVPYIDTRYGKPIQTSLCIAYVVSDTPEASRLADEKGIIRTLLDLANSAAQQADRRANYFGTIFSLDELLDGLRVLATNDDNKAKIMANNAVALIKQLLSQGTDPEKIRGIDLLWTLCFDAHVKNEIVTKYSEEIVKPLEKLAQSDDSKEVKNTANKTLVFIEKWGSNRAEKRAVSASSAGKTATSAQTVGHVFLSYSWKQQETVLLIRQELLRQSYNVWMDVDKMHGGLLDAMAKAVEDAAIVVVCFSQSYKESNPCRAEAQYAYTLGKKIVPVNMEYHYQADGWLGIIVRPLKYTDMSLKKQPFEKAVDNFMTEVKIAVGDKITSTQVRQGNTSSGTGTGTAQGATAVPSTSGSANKQPSWASWNNADVVNWIRQEKLDQVFEFKMQRFDGEKLWTLVKIREEAPEFYYQAVKELVGTGLPELLGFIAALDRLKNET